jgi:hypothetical protein
MEKAFYRQIGVFPKQRKKIKSRMCLSPFQIFLVFHSQRRKERKPQSSWAVQVSCNLGQTVIPKLE